MKDILEDIEVCTIFTMENFIIHDFIILYFILDEKYIIFLGRIISFRTATTSAFFCDPLKPSVH